MKFTVEFELFSEEEMEEESKRQARAGGIMSALYANPFRYKMNVEGAEGILNCPNPDHELRCLKKTVDLLSGFLQSEEKFRALAVTD